MATKKPRTKKQLNDFIVDELFDLFHELSVSAEAFGSASSQFMYLLGAEQSDERYEEGYAKAVAAAKLTEGIREKVLAKQLAFSKQKQSKEGKAA